jgi:hypothetical protein
MRQLDIKGAYLNGHLKEKIVMEQPPEFGDGTDRVAELNRTLYGLKQSGREWNLDLHEKLTNAGFKRHPVDHGVYTRAVKIGDRTTTITVWVDDLLVFAETKAALDAVEAVLRRNFEVKNLGEPKKIIGIEIHRDREKRTIQIGLENYITETLHKFGYEKMTSVTTPLDPNVILTKKNENEEEESESEENMAVENKVHSSRSFAEHIGALIWLATICRPDISFAVSRVGAFAANPSQVHWTTVKRIFRYLKGTSNLRLTFGGLPKNLNINDTFGAYSDADFASNPDDRKSVSGYVYMLGGGAIAWHSKKQSTMATSTTEAEYSALAAAT